MRGTFFSLFLRTVFRTVFSCFLANMQVSKSSLSRQSIYVRKSVLIKNQLWHGDIPLSPCHKHHIQGYEKLNDKIGKMITFEKKLEISEEYEKA